MQLCKEGNYFKIQKHDCEDRKNDPKSITIYIPFSTIFFLCGDILQAACYGNEGNICLEKSNKDDIMKLSSSKLTNGNKTFIFAPCEHHNKIIVTVNQKNNEIIEKDKTFVIKESDTNTDCYKNIYHYYFAYEELNYNVNGFFENLK